MEPYSRTETFEDGSFAHLIYSDPEQTKLKSRYEYNSDRALIKEIDYDDSGQRAETITNFIDGLSSEMRKYNPDGTLATEIVYYGGGGQRVRTITNFIDGLRSEMKTYNPDGALVTEIVYYGGGGQRARTITNYTNGEKTDVQIYNENGSLNKKVLYLPDKEVIYAEYSNNIKRKQVTEKNGIIVLRIEMNENGNLILELHYSYETGAITTYTKRYAHGKREHSIKYFYYPDQIVTMEEKFNVLDQLIEKTSTNIFPYDGRVGSTTTSFQYREDGTLKNEHTLSVLQGKRTLEKLTIYDSNSDIERRIDIEYFHVENGNHVRCRKREYNSYGEEISDVIYILDDNYNVI